MSSGRYAVGAGSDQSGDARNLVVRVRHDAPIPLDVEFSCGPDDVLAIYGPSGSGKTTLLRTIAGLHRPSASSGTGEAPQALVLSGGQTWTDTGLGVHLPTRERRVGFVFQDYALFPHRSARGNVMAAVHDRPRGERRAIADRWLSAVHLEGFESRRPGALSGGQRQRVALARALARDPHVLLLDEPFAAVDRAVRHRLHDELDELRRRVRVPMLLVTHDFHDVVRLATHLLLLDRGRAIAWGPIDALTSRTDLPAALHVLDTGSVFDARVRTVDATRGLAELTFNGNGYPDSRAQPAGTVSGGALLVPRGSLRPGSRVRIRVPAREVILATHRPEGLSLHNILAGQVSALGATHDDRVLVQVAIGRVRLLADVTRDAVSRLALAPGAPVFALIKSVSIEIYGAAEP